MTGRLAGRVAIVTGAGQGIGRAVGLVFAREGARVCVAEVRADRGARTAAEIAAAGGDAFAVTADVGRKDDVEAMVAETVRRFGRVDILVDNAHGFGPRAPLADVPDAQFDRSWTSGVKGTWWAMCAVHPHMAAAGGGRRLGDPETDIAPVFLFLASDDARFVTGHVIHVDGGAFLG